jgi:predicted Zn-dependent protease
LAVEHAAGAAGSPQLQALLGSLLLREDRVEAAAAALESALAGLPQPTPELQADVAIARTRLGNAAAAAAIVADLRARSATSDPVAPRWQRALQRVGAAGPR